MQVATRGFAGESLDHDSRAAPPRILVVDDEPRICHLVARRLREERYTVDTATDGRVGLHLARMNIYALVVLDLLMKGVDGFDVLDALLATGRVPAVIVLSCLSDAPSKLRCFDLGACDYLAKPFSMDELAARVRLRLRQVPPMASAVLAAAGVTLFQDRLEADSGYGAVPLTRREFRLLHELATHAGETMSKDDLLRTVWGYQFDPGTNVVDVYIRRLRNKLGAEAITTVRGKGYCLGTA